MSLVLLVKLVHHLQAQLVLEEMVGLVEVEEVLVAAMKMNL